MRDFELYQAVLGLQAPWTVVNVELDVNGQQVSSPWMRARDRIPAPSVKSASRVTIGNAAGGGIWTPVSSRRGFRQTSLG